MRQLFWITYGFLFLGLPAALQAQIDSTEQTVLVDTTLQADSLAIVGDSLALAGDSTLQDSAYRSPRQIYLDSLKVNSDITSTVEYKAKDSIIFDLDSSALFLYNDSDLNYETMNLKANKIQVKWDIQTLFAEGLEDTAGNLIGQPVFTQSGAEYGAKKIAYNFKTQKGRILGGRTAQGQDYLLSDTTKRFPDGSFFARGTKFTTCDLDHPHFYINAPKVKVLPNNFIVSGPLNLVVGDFPLPLGLPFGFIPDMKNGRRSGIILPKYGEAQDRGFFLRDFGYYWGISDYADLTFSGDIYTKGGWGVSAQANFNKRQKYNANLQVSYGVVRFGERSDPDFSETREWRLQGNVSAPIDPTLRLSGSANISSSSRYFRRVSFNANDFFQNNLASSINLSKNFNNLPVTLNLNASHRQDINKQTVSMTLPSLTIGLNRLTPFKNLSNDKALDFITRLGIDYNSQLSNQLTTMPDSILLDVLFSPRDSSDVIQVINGDSVLVRVPNSSFFRNGWRHSLNASTGTKLFKFINLTASLRATEYWYTERNQYNINPETNYIDESNIIGFTTARDFSTSFSAQTNFFGIYGLSATKRQVTFRQRFSPSVSYNLRPDFSDPQFGYWQEFNGAVDSTGQFAYDPTEEAFRRFNTLQNGIFGSPSGPQSQSIGFSLSSVLEMKYRTADSFEPDFDEKKDKFERLTLLDQLSASTSLNLAADSLRLAPINLNARTSLFNKKINLNASATLNPYEINEDGRTINQFIWDTRGKIGRLTNAQISLNTSLRSKKNKENKKSEDFDEEEFADIQENISQYVDFDIPWDLRLRYNFSYTRFGNNDPVIRQTTTFSGNFSFTSKWKIAFQSGYDVQNNEFTQTSLQILRDLHCWNLSFSWVPFGPLRSYVLVVNVASPTLRDLRLQKRNQWQDRRF